MPHSFPAGPASSRPLFAEPSIQAHYRPDGALILRSKHALTVPDDGAGFGGWLLHWGQAAPERPFLAERDETGRIRQISYGEALVEASSIAGTLAARRLDRATPVLIIAENGIDHALFMLGAMIVGQPVAPVSTAYARLGQDFGRLQHIAGLVRPQMVVVDDASRYSRALETVDFGQAELVAGRGTIPGRTITPFDAMMDASPISPPGHIGNDHIAKVLFTSGSTGVPKGVLTTHGMLQHNQESLRAIWPFVATGPVQLVDWLPWSHTFGGSHNLGLALRSGGYMLIDEGRPMPGLIEKTVANLKEVSPTVYFNVPRGYAMLLDCLEHDEALQTSFFDQLRLLFYSGASLPRPLWERLQKISERSLGHPTPITSSWGSTETAPLATSAHYPLEAAGNIGVPVPGAEIKLAPVDGRLEIRCRGPNITPGYFRAEGATAAAFDDEGWLKSGDAVRLADPAAPERGLVFDGRIAESFKLLTGTWVNVGVLRSNVVAALSPYVEDCVLTGHDRDEIGVLLFPSATGVREAMGQSENPVADLAAHPEIAARLRAAIVTFNRTSHGSSERIARAMVMSEPPQIDAGEITDKGYINQRAVLQRRASLVEALHAREPAADVIVAG